MRGAAHPGPAQQPAPAAATPTNILSNPLRHHERLVMIVLSAPTANSTATVETADTFSPRSGSKKMYAHTGTAAPPRYDKPTASAERRGLSKESALKPSSSRIMTLLHRSGSDVMCATI